jgi:predicted ATP-grasp superfamily ATP-dependent carboligase
MARGGGEQVLLTEGGNGRSRAAVAATRVLADEGFRPVVTESDGLSLAGASRYCHRKVAVPSGEDDPEAYASAVRAELAAEDYLGVLPCSDTALIALELPVQHLIDKARCAQLAASVGLPIPPTRAFVSFSELHDAAGELEYPIVVKPTLKRYLAARVESPAALRALGGRAGARDGAVVVQPWIEDGLHGVQGVMWKGRLVAAVRLRYHRVWPAPCGTIASGETAPLDREVEDRLEALLAGYDGLFACDFVGRYLLDVNPRTHATLPVAVASGANLVGTYCRLRRGEAVATVRGRAGLFFRWVEGDVRSVLWSLRHDAIGVGAAVRALRPRRATVHSYGDWRDPGPSLARARYAVRRLASAR